MARLTLSKKTRLVATIVISGGFFIAELVIGFRTKSLALVADAFHYMNDLIGFSVALLAVIVSERNTSPRTLTFGWKRAQVLGAFFNGVFLLALGLSILLQAIERFTHLTHVEDPVMVLIMGCIGLGLNVLVMSFLHENHHTHNTHNKPTRDSYAQKSPPLDPEAVAPKPSHGRDLGMLGVMIHVLGDAINNAGVIVAALVIWKGTGEGRFYADPGVSLFIAVTIMLSAWPLCRRAGHILLESAPPHVDLELIRAGIMQVSGAQAVPELRIWRIDQETTMGAAHVVVTDDSFVDFVEQANAISAYLQLHGIETVALQPRRPSQPLSISEEGLARG